MLNGFTGAVTGAISCRIDASALKEGAKLVAEAVSGFIIVTGEDAARQAFVEGKKEVNLGQSVMKGIKNAALAVALIIKGGQSVVNKISKTGVKEVGQEVTEKAIKETSEEVLEKQTKSLANNAGEVISGGANEVGWDMMKGEGYINGRKYSQHALERMAPDTPQIRAELEKRAADLAKKIGYKPQTREYIKLVEKYVDPRNIPPSVVEDAIENTISTPSKYLDTFIHETGDVKVVVNGAGDVISAMPK